MNYEEIKVILDKYDINNIEELEYCLKVFDSNDECIDDTPYEKKDCLNSKCYEEWGVPSCRRLIEIYKKYFKKNIKNKKLFIEYLIKNTTVSKSSAENYMSCKSSNQQIKKQRKEGKNIQINFDISDMDFKNDFCNNLKKKFSHHSLFKQDYRNIKDFLSVNHEITKENFETHHPIKGKRKMTKEESDRLYNISITTKKLFKNHLQIKENLIGSYEYKINLAISAFNRGLVEESLSIINKISKDKDFKENEEYLQLKVKILSVLKKDKEAIIILKKLIEKKHPTIIPETNNLLAASIKREAFKEFDLYGDEIKFISALKKAKDIYHAIYQLTNDYYPALNYIYINMMLLYINNTEKNFKDIQSESIKIWDSLEYKITDWWSFISNIEYLILIKEYDEAINKLKLQFNGLSKIAVNDFNIYSTLRQLELYSKFCTDNELIQIIHYLKKIRT